MKLLTIDLGNSRCKYGYGDAGEPFESAETDGFPIAEIDSRFCQWHRAVDRCVVSSVHSGAEEKLRRILLRLVPANEICFLDSENAPLDVAVTSPDKVGADRIAAAVGARHLRGDNVIVVDAGTAVTVDLLRDGAFQGGVIFPGFDLAAGALATNTDRLPLVASRVDADIPILGDTTDAAIQSGVFWMLVGAVERHVSNFWNAHGHFPVLLSGGTGNLIFQASDLGRSPANRSSTQANKEDCFYVEHLVLRGLWEFGQTL